VTVAGVKCFDTAGFVAECRQRRITPHVAQNLGRGGSAIDRRTTRQIGDRVSQKKRKRIEECFGRLKAVALLRKSRQRGAGCDSGEHQGAVACMSTRRQPGGLPMSCAQMQASLVTSRSLCRWRRSQIGDCEFRNWERQRMALLYFEWCEADFSRGRGGL
jgi:hypothetical protein